MPELSAPRPSWDQLYEIAASQQGLFSSRQAAEAGYSPQLLAHHLRAGRMERVRRGVYRLVHFPAGDHEDLTAIWLWSGQEGVFSHQTALALHQLSDVLPTRIHLTLPPAWSRRRLILPDGVVPHFGAMESDEIRFFGPIPATAPLRTLKDCLADNLSPEHLMRAAREALERGLVARGDLASIAIKLAPFGGIDP